MAEAKTKSSSKKPKRAKRKPAKPVAAKRKATKPVSAKRKPAKRKTSKAGSSNGASAARMGSNGASGNGASGIAGKAVLPLVAGGAALAGVVGGAALGAKRSGHKLMGVPMPKPRRIQFRTKDLRKAAQEVGGFGEHVGDLAGELRRAQDSLSDPKANSPIEVLLRGLTKRH
jgi:hypothetical protein